jgi:hypothetical protein
MGLDKPRLRVEQAEGLRTKASDKELEQRECPALPMPARIQFLFDLFVALNSAIN